LPPIGHRSPAEPHHDLARFSANHHHPQIERLTLKPCLGNPNLRQTTLAAHRVYQSPEFGGSAPHANTPPIVKLQSLVRRLQFQGAESLYFLAE
jgi:hypothetical protein